MYFTCTHYVKNSFSMYVTSSALLINVQFNSLNKQAVYCFSSRRKILKNIIA